MLLVALAVVGSALLLCGGLAVYGIGSSIYVSATEKDDMKVVLDQFMRRMAARDARGAHALFSSWAQRSTPIAQLENLLSSDNFGLFEGYGSLDLGGVSVSRTMQTDERLPQGTVARVQGAITYSSGHRGGLQAVLEKESGHWRLHGFNVVVPPEKIRSHAVSP